jgi:hypothetical protein
MQMPAGPNAERTDHQSKSGAVELLPVTKDGLNGADILYFYAVICAWSGERDLAIEQLETLAKIPAGVSYGDIRLDPFWEPLRGYPRFEKIVASLAPKPRPFLQSDFAAPRDSPKP